MPELPEVETIRRGLAPVMEGRRFTGVQVLRRDLRRPVPETLAARLTGQRVERLWRRAKYLLADLSSAETLIIHFGMSGHMLILDPGAAHPAGKHVHVIFDMEGPASIAFSDPRRFGLIDLAPTAGLLQHPLLADLGPEPLGNAMNTAWLSEHFARRRSAVKNVLLDQHVIAGLGNIYACELLFLARVSPLRSARAITPPEVTALLAAMTRTLDDAIRSGGSSLRDYRQADGQVGYFQHVFRVYDREGEPCLRPGCDGIIRRVRQSGRSSYFCPVCQH